MSNDCKDDRNAIDKMVVNVPSGCFTITERIFCSIGVKEGVDVIYLSYCTRNDKNAQTSNQGLFGIYSVK